MKKLITILCLGTILVMPSYGSGIMEDIGDGIYEMQREIDAGCHGRYGDHLAILAEHVAYYIDGSYSVDDLKFEMGVLNAGVIATDITCFFSDKRNSHQARELRLKSNYRQARQDIKHGLKIGKSKIYFVGIFAGYGLKSIFDFILP